MIAVAISALFFLGPILTSAQVIIYPANGSDSTSQDSSAAMLKIYPPDIIAYALVAGMGRIGNVGEPQETSDAVTKNYIDSLFSLLLEEQNTGLDTTICVNDGGGSHWFQYTKGRLTDYEKRPHHCDHYE